MPPWGADPAIGKFSNDVSLKQSEIDTIAAWVDAGAPQGNPADLPAAPKYATGWSIGKPDLIFKMQQPFKVPTQLAEVQQRYALAFLMSPAHQVYRSTFSQET